MQCEEVRDQFTDYLGESLVEPVRSEVQQHLISCESCRDEAAAMKDIWMKLGALPATEPDTAAMRARFEVMLEAYRHGMDHASRPTLWSSLNVWLASWWPSQPVLQFGLTVALLLIGVLVGQRYRQPVELQPAPSAELNRLRDELHDMRQMITISQLQQQSASERLKGVSWSNQIDQPDTEVLTALLDTLMHDANVNVRMAAIDALKKFGERQMVRKGVLQALEKQDSPLVQVALIDYVVEIQDTDSVDALRRISQDSEVNETVRKRAEWGLEQLQ